MVLAGASPPRPSSSRRARSRPRAAHAADGDDGVHGKPKRRQTRRSTSARGQPVCAGQRTVGRTTSIVPVSSSRSSRRPKQQKHTKLNRVGRRRHRALRARRTSRLATAQHGVLKRRDDPRAAEGLETRVETSPPPRRDAREPPGDPTRAPRLRQRRSRRRGGDAPTTLQRSTRRPVPARHRALRRGRERASDGGGHPEATRHRALAEARRVHARCREAVASGGRRARADASRQARHRGRPG